MLNNCLTYDQINTLILAIEAGAKAQLEQELKAGCDARDYSLLAGVVSDLVERITGLNPQFSRVAPEWHNQDPFAEGYVIKAKLEGTL